MKISVLDHGYLELVESWGSDERIIEAARMSTNKGFEGWGPDTSCATCRFFKPAHEGNVRLETAPVMHPVTLFAICFLAAFSLGMILFR